MANADQKITLASSRDIPFNKLTLSQSNVRRIKSGVSIEELAASIARRGLIQSLHVRPQLDGEGKETGLFEVPAGGRRYRALELLVKQKRLNKTAPVPCVISEISDEILIDEVSLAENIERAPLHPLDQFRAFLAMRDKGMSVEEIAAAFFVSAKVVKQRLRLTAVAPALLECYAEDELTLEQLMAFTVSEDHDRQQQVWDALRNSWNKEPYQIRRLLTENAVKASDRRARFIGLDAYVEAGGVIVRDLFEEDDGGWIEDVPLLERLVTEKLKAEAEAIAAEGWKWIELSIDFPYGHTSGLRRLIGKALELSEAEQCEQAGLQDELSELESQYAQVDELPEEVDTRLGAIEAALEAFEHRPVQFDEADIKRAGVFISIRHDGQLFVDRGYVRPEDEDLAEPNSIDEMSDLKTPEAITSATGGMGEGFIETEEEEDGVKPLPERLLVELTAHRTLALRDALAHNPEIAMTALLHKLVRDSFLPYPATGALEASVRQVHFPVQANDLKDSPVATSVEERHERWGERIPADEAALWHWLGELDDRDRMALLAHCVSFGINALHEKPNPYGGAGISGHGLDIRLREADRLAHATGLDMVTAGWRPTVENYLGRVTKARILQAVREGVGDRDAERIAHLKKSEMAEEAERLLADSGWLPEPLRMNGDDIEVTETDEIDTEPKADDDEEHPVAAE
ncbi:ParB/RepB/Spo0J family partition protein [Cohaesibacter haloalkalitolerans]|uniref:ParB/RepB/Spo0J family partition protein n=1 Tax=Cohaesibacter haloalkalitolerans TaxID=1162980 RepID=UPI000E654041|nr:ParB/RepB/Spo0J family partition protein [Cohaesibacter haloalkalitolerans]